MESRLMYLITAFRLYEIDIHLTAANLGQSQFILDIPIKVVRHATPLPGSLLSIFDPCRRS